MITNTNRLRSEIAKGLIKSRVKIGIAGCGVIGEGIALFIDKKLKTLAYVYALTDKNLEAAKKLRNKLQNQAKIYNLSSLIKKSDLIIEAASIEAARYILKKAIIHKKDVVILSVGALVDNLLLKQAKKKKINIYIPSGAICAIDGIGALSMGRIKKICLTTSKSPRALAETDYLKKKNINLANLKKEKIIFKGRVKEAIKYFPKNINVSATLLLASGFKNIEVCIKANPHLRRNVHKIVVVAREAKFSICIENVPSKLNPKTSALAVLSVQYLLKKIFSSLKIGS